MRQVFLNPYHSQYEQWNLRWSWKLLPAGTAEPSQASNGVVRLEANNIPAFQTEDFMPPENELKSRVDFVYSLGSYEPNPDKFWKKTGKKFNERLENLLGRPNALAQAAAEIVSSGHSPEGKAGKDLCPGAAAAQHFFRDRENRARNQARAAEGAEQRCRCVETGFGQRGTAHLALSRAGVGPLDLRPMACGPRTAATTSSTPRGWTARRLDANIVLVKLNGKDIYCDPGAKFVPFGLLPWSETGVAGLRMDKEGGSWIWTPLPESSASRIERHAELKLSSDSGSLEGKLTVTYTGLEAAERRTDERNVDEAERKEFLENAVKEYIPAAATVQLANQPDWDNSTPTLVAEFNLTIPGWAAGAGRRALLPVGLFSAPEKHLFDHTERLHPIYMDFPFQLVDDVTVELPPGWQVSSLPPAQDQEGHVVAYTLKMDGDKRKLHLARTLNVDFLMIDTKYYLALRNFFQIVRTGDEEQIVLQPGTATASN